MKAYKAALLRHLGTYARKRLGVFEQGTWQGRAYAHILPYRLRFLNFLESTRSELQDYLVTHPSITLHKYFHHLNSSQAFALNLFFPYFSKGGHSARALSRSLGIDAHVSNWEFEDIPDQSEGTNVDVAWNIPGGAPRVL
jgi:hypothetical protein